MALRQEELSEVQLAAEFGGRTRALRKQANLSQERLAQRMEVSRETIRRIEKGEHLPGWRTMFRLANALGVSVSQLFPERFSPAPRTTGAVAA